MKIILTGATGYVGEGVMLELLREPKVEKMLSVSRRPVEIDKYDCLTQDEKNKLEEYIAAATLEWWSLFRPSTWRARQAQSTCATTLAKRINDYIRGHNSL